MIFQKNFLLKHFKCLTKADVRKGRERKWKMVNDVHFLFSFFSFYIQVVTSREGYLKSGVFISLSVNEVQ